MSRPGYRADLNRWRYLVAGPVSAELVTRWTVSRPLHTKLDRRRLIPVRGEMSHGISWTLSESDYREMREKVTLLVQMTMVS